MKQLLITLSFLISSIACYCQDVKDVEIDSLYKEDQFYAGITYNLLGKKPEGITQNGFSFGLHLGFIKDIPINKNRNVAIGIGLGYATNSYNQNLLINKSDTGEYTYSALQTSSSFIKNKFSTHVIDVPIEFRWRTSTPTDYNFWRIYTGFKLGYIFGNTAKHRGDLGRIKHTNIKDFNRFQYGVYMSAGYNTWNIYLYYALNAMFSDKVTLDDHRIDMNAIKVGLMFYML